MATLHPIDFPFYRAAVRSKSVTWSSGPVTSTFFLVMSSHCLSPNFLQPSTRGAARPLSFSGSHRGSLASVRMPQHSFPRKMCSRLRGTWLIRTKIPDGRSSAASWWYAHFTDPTYSSLLNESIQSTHTQHSWGRQNGRISFKLPHIEWVIWTFCMGLGQHGVGRLRGGCEGVSCSGRYIQPSKSFSAMSPMAPISVSPHGLHCWPFALFATHSWVLTN